MSVYIAWYECLFYFRLIIHNENINTDIPKQYVYTDRDIRRAVTVKLLHRLYDTQYFANTKDDDDNDKRNEKKSTRNG